MQPKMMPGQTPYTAAEMEQLAALVNDAAAGDPGEAGESAAFAELAAEREAAAEPRKMRSGGGKSLVCCCCGGRTIGRQWYNRDTGFGLCRGCIKFVGADVAIGTETSGYGVRGYHFDIPGTDW